MKKAKINLTLLSVLTLLIIFLGATYAYFQAQKGQGASAFININSDTTDSLTFSVGDAINITASTDDFYEGGDNKSGKTTATARLVPNNTTNEAHEKYNVYFIIDANDFIYTTENKQVEVLLKVQDPDGNPLKSIEGLNYHEDLEGFDITKSQGAFKITLNNPIDATSEDGTTETWNFEVILRNLSTNQALNAGKSFSGKVLITTDTQDTYVVPEINSIKEDSKTYESITVSLIENELHSSDIDKYYFAIEATDEEPESASIMSIAEKLEPTYQASNKNSYTFNGLQENQNYKIYAYAEDVQGIRSGVKTAIIKTNDYTRVQVTDVTVSEKTHSSIKVKATASNGTKNVTEYGFKIENHETYGEWSWQASDEFQFTGLKAGNTYNIQVTAKDELNKEATNSFDKMETTTPFTVKMKVVGGTSNPLEQGIIYDGGGDFTIIPSEGYTTEGGHISCPIDIVRNYYFYTESNRVSVSKVIGDAECTVTLKQAVKPAHEFVISKVGTKVGEGTEQLLQHTTDLANSAGDNSYRYSGNNPNNFVCFGNGSENYNNGGDTCPDTNLYRIIGVFDNQVKLIKSEYITDVELGLSYYGSAYDLVGDYISLKRVKNVPTGGFPWSANVGWENAILNQNLNSNYLANLGNWANKIAITSWNQYGNNTLEVTAKGMYDAERQFFNTVLQAKIGLIYVSDYGFASEQNIWTSTLKNYNNVNNKNRENNWLFNGVNEWTIGASLDNDFFVTGTFIINVDGNLQSENRMNFYGVRPAFYLNSDVKIKVDDAIGNVNNPFRIVV